MRRNAAAAEFVANRHKNRKMNDKSSKNPLQTGDVVYRKGQPCTVVQICYDTSPPHCVVRTEAGQEVGTEIGLVSREKPQEVPPTPPKPTRKSCTGQNALRPNGTPPPADQSASEHVQDPAVDELDLGVIGSGTEKRHAALKRMRERRSERAKECAQERDDMLHGLLAENNEDWEEERSHRQKFPVQDRSVQDKTAELAAMEAQLQEMEAQLKRPQVAVASAKSEVALTKCTPCADSGTTDMQPIGVVAVKGKPEVEKPNLDKPKEEKRIIKKELPRGGALGSLAETRGWVLPAKKPPKEKGENTAVQVEKGAELAEQAENAETEQEQVKDEVKESAAKSDPLLIMMRKVMEDDLSPQRQRKEMKAVATVPEAWKAGPAGGVIESAVPVESSKNEEDAARHVMTGRVPEVTKAGVSMKTCCTEDQYAPEACSSTCAPRVPRSAGSSTCAPSVLESPLAGSAGSSRSASPRALEKAIRNVERNVLSESADDCSAAHAEETNQTAKPQGEDAIVVDGSDHQVEGTECHKLDPTTSGLAANDQQEHPDLESSLLVACPEAEVAHASIEHMAQDLDLDLDEHDFLSCSKIPDLEQTQKQEKDKNQKVAQEEVSTAEQEQIQDHGVDQNVEFKEPFKVDDRDAKEQLGLQQKQVDIMSSFLLMCSSPVPDMEHEHEQDQDKNFEVAEEEIPMPLFLTAGRQQIQDLLGNFGNQNAAIEAMQEQQLKLPSEQFAKVMVDQDAGDVMQEQQLKLPAEPIAKEIVLKVEKEKTESGTEEPDFAFFTFSPVRSKAEQKVSQEEQLRLQAEQAKAEAAEAQRKAQDLEEKLKAVYAELEARKNGESTLAITVEAAQTQPDVTVYTQADSQEQEEEMNDEDDVDAPLPLVPVAVEDATTESEAQEPSVEVLLLVDASSAAHVPLSLAHTPVDEWDEDAWDEFGKHLRLREAPCRLEPLGLKTLAFLAPALRGLIVETQLCGEDPSEPMRSEQFDAVCAGKLWRRSLLGGTALWERAVTSARKLHSKGLKCVIMIASGADGRSEEPYCGDAGARTAADEMLALGLPVHCLTLGAPKAESQCREVSARTGGLFVTLPGVADLLEDDSTHIAALNRLSQTLGNLPRRDGELDPESFLNAAATVIQCAYRARVRRLKRLKVLRSKAALRIATAYGRWRLRRCIRELAKEAKRWRRAAPVRAAEKARADAVREVEMAQSAKIIQSYWRARKITLWCQRIDKGARRLQAWFHRRKARQEAAKWRKLQIEKRKMGSADPPPIPPSQWGKPEEVEKEVEKETPKEGFVLGNRQPQPWEVRQRDQIPGSMCPCPAMRPPDRPRSRGEETAALLPAGYSELPGIRPPSQPRDSSLPSPRRHLSSMQCAAPAIPCAPNPYASTQPLEMSRTLQKPASPRHSTTSFCRRVPGMNRSVVNQNRMGGFAAIQAAVPAIGLERGRRAMDRTFL